MNSLPDFRVEWEWEPAAGIRAPELRATFARLQIFVGDQCITLVEDRETGSSRRSIAVSLYPLAEWIAFNWWFLLVDSRNGQSLSSGRSWTSASTEVKKSYQRHGLRNAGDGFLWPDLVILPEGVQTKLVWRPDYSSSTERPIRFLTQGEGVVDSGSFQQVLTHFVDSVLDRLSDANIDDTPLHQEWRSIRAIDSEESDYCLAAARLGLDPYAEAVDYEDEILRVDRELPAELVSDFLDVVDPAHIRQALRWATSARSRILELSDPSRRIDSDFLAHLTDVPASISRHQPWWHGYGAAKELRSHLGLRSTESFAVESYVATQTANSPDLSLQAFGAVREDSTLALILGRHIKDTGQRFNMARAMWHLLLPDKSRQFFITAGHSVQHKVERAFAAELLAPADGIAQMIEDVPEGALQDEIENIGNNFRVSPLVVQRQIENQLEIAA